MRCRTFDRGGTAPPSVLPDISPTRREIGLHHLISPTTNLAKRDAVREVANLPPSGEMSGRTEGGAKDRYRALLF
ncbi:MAG: hypothetical protein E5Y63_02340 [Mesorhizobium sp.]|nr:MAG: hypothetical protein E5Y63_02340 [Mesorhizobium sp.]